ncbi:hypothetical protein JNUCC32_31220 (plasmid) [Paenibacillus sp. JNUCC32]|uniref:hypothetical protein n=1 Tax=Paenibacillus sp. JNUCC32 TaxID=2777984 RepID=UPI0017885EF4|nr:hypothetical protein [Paenibacillus sp. JNUCC-32]QOT13759.1 hypothetical protein JNUCC32_31220 [Paenibacillus sp. JNUCC-32]
MNENKRTAVMVTLPIIPKEVAEVIEKLRRNPDYGDAFICDLASRTGGGLHNDTITLRLIPFDTLLSALVNGYVVEKSAEELAHECIRAEYRYYCGDPYGRGARHGIIYTLETFGIKIEGVNA